MDLMPACAHGFVPPPPSPQTTVLALAGTVVAGVWVRIIVSKFAMDSQLRHSCTPWH